jgi:hypothetical protein
MMSQGGNNPQEWHRLRLRCARYAQIITSLLPGDVKAPDVAHSLDKRLVPGNWHSLGDLQVLEGPNGARLSSLFNRPQNETPNLCSSV